MLKDGSIAMNFLLEGDDGKSHSLSDYENKYKVIFFYPKDLTPGCTSEACEFTDLFDEFKKEDAVLLGISKDSLASHLRFKSKHSLKMLLLSDPDLLVHKAYFCYQDKTLFQKLVTGVIRSTFLIDKEQKIIKAWYNVRVKNHAKTVLETLKKFKNAEGGTRTHTGNPGRF